MDETASSHAISCQSSVHSIARIALIATGGVATGVAVWFILAADYPLLRDEIWHWPAALVFGGGLPDIRVLASYFAGPGPLSYILWGNLHAAGVGLAGLRLTSLFSLVVFLIGTGFVARQLRTSTLALPIAFMLVQPYILTNGFLLMTDCLALALAVWTLYHLIAASRSKQLHHWIKAAVLMVALLYTRISFLSIPIGLALASLMDRDNRRPMLAAGVASIACVGPLVALWGGMVPLTLQGVHHPAFDPRHLNHMLAWLGFFFWPYLLSRSRWDFRAPIYLWGIPLLGLLSLTQWFMPFDDSATAAAGVVDNMIVMAGRFGPQWLSHVVFLVLWMFGLVLTTHAIMRAWGDPVRRMLAAMILPAATLPVLHPWWWERHALPVYLLVGLLAWTEPLKRRRVAVAWLIALAALALAHLIHVVVFFR